MSLTAAETPVYLGIDIGTSGLRGSCINHAAEELCHCRIPFELDKDEDENSNRQQQPDRWLHG